VYGGLHIYKETLLLPSRRAFNVNTIQRALRSQAKRPLPYSIKTPVGTFKTIFSDGGSQICLLKFRAHVGCRSVTSTYHGDLPNIVKKNEHILPAQSFGIGYKFMYMQDENFSTDTDATIRDAVETVENVRRDQLISDLQTRYPQFKISSYGGIEDHYCHFSGGGDVLMVPSVNSPVAHVTTFCVLLGRRIECETLELKYMHASCDALELQLQANMELLGSKSLLSVLWLGKSIDAVTVYGLGFGVFHKLVLLQLEVNFINKTKVFTELYIASPSPNYHQKIDSSIQHIVSKLLHV
jgi:hypothetical protein